MQFASSCVQKLSSAHDSSSISISLGYALRNVSFSVLSFVASAPISLENQEFPST